MKNGIWNSVRPYPLQLEYFGKVGPIVLMCLLAAILYTYRLGALSFENQDHFQFVKTADEMVQSGNALALTLNNRPYMNKPHLLFWSIWLFSLPFGSVNTISARLPSVLSAIGCIALVFLLSDELFGRSAAYLSSVILLTTWEFAMDARRVRFDIMLAMFTALALYLLLKGSRSDRQKPMWYVAGGIAAALAFLTKGPPAFIHILVPFALFLLVTRKSRFDWNSFMKAIALAAIILGIWMFFYVRAVGLGEILKVFNNEVVARVNGAFEKQAKPFYYYLYSIPGCFLPWTLLMPALLLYFFPKEIRKKESVIFPLLWLLPTVVIFSLIPAKDARFIYPEFPALAILVGALYSDRLNGSLRAGCYLQGFVDWATIGPAFLVSPLLAVFSVLIALFLKDYTCLYHPTLLFAVFSLPPTYVLIRSAERRTKLLAAIGLIALVSMYAQIARVSYLASRNEAQSPFLTLYNRNLDRLRSSALYGYKFASEELDFYNRKPIEDIETVSGLRESLDASEKSMVFLQEPEFEGLPEEIKQKLIIVDKVSLRRGKGTLLLIARDNGPLQ